jgi:hypothetical protein
LVGIVRHTIFVQLSPWQKSQSRRRARQAMNRALGSSPKLLSSRTAYCLELEWRPQNCYWLQFPSPLPGPRPQTHMGFPPWLGPVHHLQTLGSCACRLDPCQGKDRTSTVLNLRFVLHGGNQSHCKIIGLSTGWQGHQSRHCVWVFLWFGCPPFV